MKTSDVKVNKTYMYKGEKVIVLQKIKGGETSQREMQSGQLFTGYKRKRKKFRLSNGDIVYSDLLKEEQK
jgi:hypothetical protein